MKLKAPLDSLTAAIELAAQCATAHHPLVELSTGGGSLIAKCGDGTRTLTVRTPATITLDGSTAVNAKRLIYLLRACDPSGATASLTLTPKGLSLESGFFRSRLNIAAAPPASAPVTVSPVGTIGGTELLRALKCVANVAAKGEAVITCLRLDADDAYLFVATDGRRLHTLRCEAKGATARASLTIPASAFGPLSSLAKPDATLTIAAGKNMATFATETAELRFALDARDYPAWQRVVPKDTKALCNIDRMKLTEALERASIISGAKENAGVVLDFDGDTLQVKGDFDGEACVETVPIQPGTNALQKFTVGISATYLLSALNGDVCDTVTFRVPSACQPAETLTGPLLMQTETSDFTAVVMPQRRN